MNRRFCSIFLLTACTSFAPAIGASGQGDGSAVKEHHVRDTGSDLPTIDLTNADTTAMSSHAPKSALLAQVDQTALGDPIPTDVDRIGGYPALPVNVDLILTGTVTQRNASIEPNGASTTLSVSITGLVKESSNISLKAGDNISIRRFGGNVRLSSNRVLTYRNFGERMPQVGKTYLFFLQRNPDNVWQIVTGYSVDGAFVHPLDDPQIRSTYAKFDGAPLDRLLTETRSAIAQTGTH